MNKSPARFHPPQADQVHEMFGKVSGRYDITNSVLSAGFHHSWRKEVLRAARLTDKMQILDCATGTGDLAIVFAEELKRRNLSGFVHGTDFCADMLKFAPAKARQRNVKLEFSVADATKLPFADESFDLVSISFGIRNLNNPTLGLSEMSRVLKPGGQLLVLEFGQPKGVFGKVFNWYSEHVLPRVGGLLTGVPQAYSYLQKTSAQFPCGTEFEGMLMQTPGLASARSKSLMGGICYLYSADRTGDRAGRI